MFIIKNYLSGALLWYRHASMRVTDSIVDDQLYEGTAKSAEGYLASVLFRKTNEEGCNILVNWQDQDSSAKKSFRQDSQQIIKMHVKKFPTVESVSCCCFGNKHKFGCGCITNSFIQAAKLNLYCAITQCGNNALSFAERMSNLGRY